MEPHTQNRDDLLLVAFGDGRSLERLSAVRALQSLLDGLCGELVEASRAENASWVQVGDALGVTRQAARQRFALKPAEFEPASATVPSKEPRAGNRPGWDVRVPGGFRVLEIVRRR